MTDRRHPYDGKPYYCDNCGLGLGEFMACDEPDCRLETEEDAQGRAAAHGFQGGKPKRSLDLDRKENR